MVFWVVGEYQTRDSLSISLVLQPHPMAGVRADQMET